MFFFLTRRNVNAMARKQSRKGVAKQTFQQKKETKTANKLHTFTMEWERRKKKKNIVIHISKLC